MATYVWPIIHDILNNPPISIARESNTLWPSAMGVTIDVNGWPTRIGGCNRKQYYRLLRYPQDPSSIDFPGEVKRRFGDFASQFMADIFKTGWLYIGDEIPAVIPRRTPGGVKYKISGKIDIMIRRAEGDNWPILIEVKSKGQFAENGLCKPTRGNAYTAPKPLMPDLGEVIQCMPYLEWARTDLGIDDPEIHLMYLTRDRVSLGEHIVRFNTDDSIIVENAGGVHHISELTLPLVYADTDALVDSVRAKTVPDRPYVGQWSNEYLAHKLQFKGLNKSDTEAVRRGIQSGKAEPYIQKGDWQCNYCEYRSGCDGHNMSFEPGLADNSPVTTLDKDDDRTLKVHTGE